MSQSQIAAAVAMKVLILSILRGYYTPLKGTVQVERANRKEHTHGD